MTTNPGQHVIFPAKASSAAATGDYKEKFALWDKNFVAVMEGKGYTVK